MLLIKARSTINTTFYIGYFGENPRYFNHVGHLPFIIAYWKNIPRLKQGINYTRYTVKFVIIMFLYSQFCRHLVAERDQVIGQLLHHSRGLLSLDSRWIVSHKDCLFSLHSNDTLIVLFSVNGTVVRL